MGIVLRGARVWEGGDGEIPPTPRDLAADRGVITSRPPGSAAGAREILLPEGAVALPGLIDAHVHLDLDPLLLSPDDQLAVPREVRDQRMIARARDMVRAGITTVRDLGAGEHRELRLRDAVGQGELEGPRILCAGQPLTTPGGHCHFWGGGADGRAEQAAVVDRQLERGVDWIKVMATGGVFTKGSGVDRAQFDEDELRAVVERARAAGRPVAAHCHGAAGIRNAARAGVRSIEHCSFAGKEGFGAALDPEVVSDVARSGAWVSPTVNAGWLRRIEKDGEPTPFHERMRAVLAALRGAGVPLVASTDAGIPGVHHAGLARALSALSHYARLSPLETLRSATSDAAQALGIGHVCGRLLPGLSADVVVVPGDPSQDLAHLEQPLLVLARGRVVLDRRADVAGGAGDGSQAAPAEEAART